MTLLWIETTLEEIADIQTGSTPSKKNSQFYGDSFPLFKPGDLGSIYPLSYSDECLSDEGKAVARFIPANSTYVTCIGATIGKTGFVNVDATCNQQINTLTPLGGIVPKLMFYWMISPQMNHQVINGSSSTTMPIINKSRFSKLHCVLPPLAEQKVIADKLDTLLAQVETTKARLDRIPEIIKRFRQSVLSAAVSGKLTEVSIANLGELNQCANIVSGLAFKKSQYSTSGSRLLQIANVGYGRTKWEDCNYIPLELARECEVYSMADGDIVLALNRPITNETLKVAWVEERDLPATLYQRVARIRCKENGLSSEYLFLLMQSPDFLKMVEGNLKGSDQPYLNTSDLASFDIYAPDEVQQTEIVRRVEELFAFADSIEQKATAALARVNNLTQSILAKAFRGELTADWRAANPELISGDNSAAALLEKIKAERAALVGKKTRKKA